MSRRRTQPFLRAWLSMLASLSLWKRAGCASWMTARSLIYGGSLLLLLLSIFGAGPAVAQTCTPTASTLAFGEVASQVLASQVVDVQGTISYTCSGSNNDNIRICLELDNFNGSNTRTMTATGGTLDFQIYQDAARTIRWGNRVTSNIMTINTAIGPTGTLNGSVTMYGRIFAGQTTEPDGSYIRNMNGGTRQRLTVSSNTLGGNQCGDFNTGQVQFSFTATATISNHCNISASALNFGSHGLLSATVDQTSAITAQCTNTTPYNVGLSAGLGAGATVTTRKMTSGGSTVDYSLYRDSSRTQVWGTTIGTDTASGTGNGGDQSYTVYGRVAPQNTPAPATYSDTITVTATY